VILLAFAACSYAQTNVNFKGYGDTAQITAFKADSFKQTKAFNLTNAENKCLIVALDDTSNAGISGDSIACEIGYRFGVPTRTLAGELDVVWSGPIPVDTCDITAGTGLYDSDSYTGTPWTIDLSNDISARPQAAVDTTLGEATMIIPINPPWGAYIKFYIRGLTGNKIGSFVKVRFTFEQRGWVPVKQM
jgi:hypothetical protein